jgi:hypothetical protein
MKDRQAQSAGTPDYRNSNQKSGIDFLAFAALYCARLITERFDKLTSRSADAALPVYSDRGFRPI